MLSLNWLTSRPLIAVVVTAIVAILLNLGHAPKDKKNEQSDDKNTLHSQASSEEQASSPSALNAAVEDAGDAKANVTSSATTDAQAVEKNTENTAKMSSLSDANQGNDSDELNDDELLKVAREAYWNHGYEEAARTYQTLVSKYPNKAEYIGELGNVYLTQGYSQMAAEMYANAADILVKNGELERVYNMLPYIQLYYPERAQNLLESMQASR